MTGPRNSWGYDTAKEPFPQLLRLLGISGFSGAAFTLRSRLRDLCVSYLDCECTLLEQPSSNLRNIWKKISQEYPYLFLKLNTEDRVQRIFFVLHVVARIHNNRCPRRRYTKAKGIGSQKPQKPRKRQKQAGLETISRQIELAERMEVIEQVDSDLEGSDSETGDVSQILVANGAKNCRSTGANWQSVPKAIPTKPQVPRSLSPGATVKPSTSRKSITSYFKLTEPSSKNKSYSQGHVSSIPALPTSNKRAYTYEEPPPGNTPPNTLPSRPSSTPQLPVNLATCNEIRTFLSRCRPPLTHLLPNFLAYGCTSEEYLRAVAAFPETKRREVLRGILGTQVNHGDLNSAGRKVIVKELDLDLLEDHFDKCFEE